MRAAVVRGLAEEKLTQFADHVQARILQSASATEEERSEWAAKQDQNYKTSVESNSSFYDGFLQVSGESLFSVLARETYRAVFDIMLCTGLAGVIDMHQLIEEGNGVHMARNARLHTDDRGLRKVAEFLHRRGFVEMMKEEMPYQCALVINLEWILSNSHGFSHAK